MVRHYKKKSTARKMNYSQESVKSALKDICKGMTIRKAAEKYGVPRSTLQEYLSGKTKEPGKVGRKTALPRGEEEAIAYNVAALGAFGLDFSMDDLRYFIKDHLELHQRRISQFKDNLPGIDWGCGFLERHHEILTQRMCHKEHASSDLLACLKKTRETSVRHNRPHSKKFHIQPAQSVTLTDLEASVSGNIKREQPQSLDVSEEELNHEVQSDLEDEFPQECEDDDAVLGNVEYNQCDYVLVQFDSAKLPFHYVAKLKDKVSDKWDATCYRKCEQSVAKGKMVLNEVAFKLSETPNVVLVDPQKIVMKLHVIEIKRGKIVLRDTFGSLFVC